MRAEIPSGRTCREQCPRGAQRGIVERLDMGALQQRHQRIFHPNLVTPKLHVCRPSVAYEDIQRVIAYRAHCKSPAGYSRFECPQLIVPALWCLVTADEWLILCSPASGLAVLAAPITATRIERIVFRVE